MLSFTNRLLKPTEKKPYTASKTYSLSGAFARGERVLFNVTLDRRDGFRGVVMRICRDGGNDRDIAFDFDGFDLQKGQNTYSLVLDTEDMETGLYFYELLFLKGINTRFTDSVNNVDFRLSPKSGNRFMLTVYRQDFSTPESFGGGIIYHIFVDRFCKGKGHVEYPEYATLSDVWEGGIPQYAEVQGGEVANDLFFGGNLWGVTEKLPYLASLGVTHIYLSPIFKARSNHKYDTGDYEIIDPEFGGEPAFDELISKAREHGIKLILDGVFNHTGDDSKYFNRYGNYEGLGAYQSKDSKYSKWYNFEHFPDKYASWWGIVILPKLNIADPECQEYIAGEQGIVAKYIEKGIGGWRLDVADELDDSTLDLIRRTAKEKSRGECVVIGEVWENAANKVAYGRRRRYFEGRQLDSVMNYPVKDAIIDFVLSGNPKKLENTLKELYSSYPRCVSDSLMNLLGTHDTERIITVLGDNRAAAHCDNKTLSVLTLTKEERRKAIKRLKLASVLQYTVFGVPSLYYGDEVGLEGYRDPFNRKPFPWSELERTDRTEILEHYRTLGEIRRTQGALDRGCFTFLFTEGQCIAFKRKKKNHPTLTVVVNAGNKEIFIDRKKYDLHGTVCDLISKEKFSDIIELAPETAVVLAEV